MSASPFVVQHRPQHDLQFGCEQQKLAVDSGHWPLFRFDPRLAAKGQQPLQLDSAPPKTRLMQCVKNETRYRMVEQMNPTVFNHLIAQAQFNVAARYMLYEQMSKLPVYQAPAEEPQTPAEPTKA